jgi:phosphatidate cytidylyltransferase
LPRRELFALVALPLVVGVIVWLPAWVFLTVLGAVAVGAGDELLALARRSGIPTYRWLPLACLAGLMAAAWSMGVLGFAWAAAVTLTILPAAQLARRDGPAGSLSAVAVACLAVLYLGLGATCLGWLRLWPEPAAAVRLVLLYLGTVWIGDSAAYYLGTRLGRHRMSPQISPKKTWEGLAAGTVATFLGAAGLRQLLAVELGWPQVAVIAVILAVAAPLGDLVESQFKRDTGVKDSSSLLPGHGGLLDRADSLLYAAPPVVGYLAASGLAP